jgi:hypothetical protein
MRDYPTHWSGELVQFLDAELSSHVTFENTDICQNAGGRCLRNTRKDRLSQFTSLLHEVRYPDQGRISYQEILDFELYSYKMGAGF